MSIMELNAELYRAMSEIADDEVLMTKVLRYVKRLASRHVDESMMTREEFMSKLERGEEEYARGECRTMQPGEDLDHFIQRVG